MSLIDALSLQAPPLAGLRVYEMSTRGALLRHLRRRGAIVQTSEYLPEQPRGTTVNGVRCEDVQALTFPDTTFDICTSTEVFEHVPDDRAGFSEIVRVLRPGGILAFTVPMSDAAATIERARLVNGRVEHLEPPEFHGDRLRGPGSVLVYRDYGHDLIQRLRDAGFAQAWLHVPACTWMGFRRTVAMARRA